MAQASHGESLQNQITSVEVVLVRGWKSLVVTGAIKSGQIIATSTTIFFQKVAFWKGNPLISGKSRLVKYYNLARLNGTHFGGDET